MCASKSFLYIKFLNIYNLKIMQLLLFIFWNVKSKQPSATNEITWLINH